MELSLLPYSTQHLVPKLLVQSCSSSSMCLLPCNWSMLDALMNDDWSLFICCYSLWGVGSKAFRKTFVCRCSSSSKDAVGSVSYSVHLEGGRRALISLILSASAGCCLWFSQFFISYICNSQWCYYPMLNLLPMLKKWDPCRSFKDALVSNIGRTLGTIIAWNVRWRAVFAQLCCGNRPTQEVEV